MVVKQKESDSREKRRFYVAVGMAGQVTLLLVGPVFVLLIVGLWIDEIFYTTPLFIILGVILGFVGGVFNVFKVMKKMDRL